MSQLYFLKRRKHNSTYYELAEGLWREYMPSRGSAITFGGFIRLMSQRPAIQDPEAVWEDLVRHGNLVG